jgi:hypothetical protein
MALRHRSSHVQRTLYNHVRANLAPDWTTEPVLFGAAPLRYVEGQSMDDAPAADLRPNVLYLTLADEGPDSLQQLGGGLYEVTYSLFVDVYGETGQMAWRILEDVKRLLHERVLRVVDYAPSTPVQTDEQVELDVIAIEPPGRATSGERSMEARRRWRVLTAWAHVTFMEDD